MSILEDIFTEMTNGDQLNDVELLTILAKRHPDLSLSMLHKLVAELAQSVIASQVEGMSSAEQEHFIRYLKSLS